MDQTTSLDEHFHVQHPQIDIEKAAPRWVSASLFRYDSVRLSSQISAPLPLSAIAGVIQAHAQSESTHKSHLADTARPRLTPTPFHQQPPSPRATPPAPCVPFQSRLRSARSASFLCGPARRPHLRSAFLRCQGPTQLFISALTLS